MKYKVAVNVNLFFFLGELQQRMRYGREREVSATT
jgi:hypothetical protein